MPSPAQGEPRGEVAGAHSPGHGARALHAQAWLVGADQPGAPRRAERALDVYVCRRLCRGERQRRGVRPRRGPRPLVAAKGGACDGAQGRGVAPRPARASRNFLRRHARVPLWQGAGPDRLTRPRPPDSRSPARPLVLSREGSSREGPSVAPSTFTRTRRSAPRRGRQCSTRTAPACGSCGSCRCASRQRWPPTRRSSSPPPPD